MEAYTGFATVYDLFMDNIPYNDWANYLEKIFNMYGLDKGLLLELGCGTGSMTRRMAEKGYDMIGIDASEDMLAIARERNFDYNNSILYLCQDMRQFELYGTVSGIYSVCDTINYLVTEEDLIKTFTLANIYLDRNGIFIFDLDTPYAYEKIIGDRTIAEDRDEASFIWENTYYKDEMINEINLSLFIHEDDDMYRKYKETHYRRAYSLEKIRELLEEAGMEWVAAYDTLTFDKPRDDSERVYIVAREKEQVNKHYI